MGLEELVEELFNGDDLMEEEEVCEDEEWLIEEEQLVEDVELDEKMPVEKTTIKKRGRKSKSVEISCNFCKRLFESEEHLKNHKCGGGGENSGEEEYRCALCGQVCGSSEKLAFHRTFHTAELMNCNLKCNVCADETSTTIVELYDHLNTNHNNSFKCLEPQCDKEFQLRSSLRTHSRVHGKKKFKCDKCTKVFFDFHSLTEHSVTHLQSKPFQCHICFKFVNRRSRLRMHIMAHEAQPRENAVFSCKHCEMAFKDVHDSEVHICNSEECRNAAEEREDVDMEMLNEAENKKMNLFEADPQPVAETIGVEGEASNLHIAEESKDGNETKIEDTKIKNEEALNGEEIETREVLMSHSVKRMTVEELEAQLSPLGKLFIKVVNIRMVFRCEYCEKVFCVRDALNVHRSIHADKENPFVCNVCNAEFSSYSRCTSHKTMHGFYKPRKHEDDDVKGYEPFPVVKHFLCQICNKTFLHWSYLQVHKRTKHNDAAFFFQCKLCGEKFRESWILNSHRKKAHPEILAPKKLSNNYKCVECDAGFNTRKQLGKHMEVNHVGSPHNFKSKPGPFGCPICEKVYVTKIGIDGHMRLHNGGVYLCALCGNGFAHRTGLETHHKRVHLREQRHTCTTCNQSFFSTAELEGHRRCHTGEKPFRCNFCSQSFRTKGRRNEHHRVHTGERPYPCDICGLAFRRSHAMKNHRRIHTGEKDYRCPHCAKLFHVRSNLNTHIKHKHPGQFVVLEVEGGPEVRAALEESLQLLSANDKIKKELLLRRGGTVNGVDEEIPDAPDMIVEDVIIEGEDISNHDAEYVYGEPMYLTQQVKDEDGSIVSGQAEIIVDEGNVVGNEPIILQEGDEGVQIQYIDDGTKLIEYEGVHYAVEQIPGDDGQVRFAVRYDDQVEGDEQNVELILGNSYEESPE